MMIIYGTSDEAIIRTFAYNIFPRSSGPVCILMNPQHAGIMAKSGWTKEDVSDFICEYARAPISHMPYHWNSFISGPNQTIKGISGQKGMLLSPKDSSQESVRILRNPELSKICVTGGPGGDVGMLLGAGRWVKKKIELPLHWDNLVKK